MNDFLDQAALRAMAVLLEEDLHKAVDKQKGPQWIAKTAYDIALAMNTERTSVMTRIYEGS